LSKIYISKIIKDKVLGILEGIAIKGLTTLTTTLIRKFVDVGWNKVAEEFEASFNNEDLISFCKACDEYVNIRTLYSSQHDVFIDDVYVPFGDFQGSCRLMFDFMPPYSLLYRY
jgi:hypothetical protein